MKDEPKNVAHKSEAVPESEFSRMSCSLCSGNGFVEDETPWGIMESPCPDCQDETTTEGCDRSELNPLSGSTIMAAAFEIWKVEVDNGNAMSQSVAEIAEKIEKYIK